VDLCYSTGWNAEPGRPIGPSIGIRVQQENRRPNIKLFKKNKEEYSKTTKLKQQKVTLEYTYTVKIFGSEG